MAFDITRKRALETGLIDLVNGDGSPLYDDDGNVLSVTVHGPGSKLWQQADAERRRRLAVKLERNQNKISSIVGDARSDEVDFLCAVTVSFNGWEYPHPEAATGGRWPTPRDMFRAAYMDDTIGYIRDHVHKEANEWSSFMGASRAG
jgi:hypothetical protein